MNDQIFELAVPAPVIPPSDVERQAVAEVSNRVDRYAQQVLARHETAPTPAPKKRMRSAARKGLETAIAQFDELLSGDALKDKPAKRADIVIEKARALKELLALEAEERATETQDKIDRLEAQHTDDNRRLTTLEVENTTLRTKAIEVKTVTVQDPEHSAVREQNATLTAALKFVAETLSNAERPQMAIRVITSCPPAVARIFCPLVGVDFTSYVQMLQTYRTDAELQSVIDKAKYEGPAVIFARAALAVRDAEPAKRMTHQSSGMSAEEKIRAAREMVNPGRTLRVVPSPIQTAEENMRTQPREIVGSPDAIPYRERITPVSVNTLGRLAQREEISGGADFSPWVR